MTTAHLVSYLRDFGRGVSLSGNEQTGPLLLVIDDLAGPHPQSSGPRSISIAVVLRDHNDSISWPLRARPRPDCTFGRSGSTFGTRTGAPCFAIWDHPRASGVHGSSGAQGNRGLLAAIAGVCRSAKPRRWRE